MEEEKVLFECNSMQLNDSIVNDPTHAISNQELQYQNMSKQQKIMERCEEIKGEPNTQQISQDEIKSVEKSVSEQYWMSKKNEYVEELNKLLIQGIDQSDQQLYEVSVEFLNQKISEANDIISDQSKSDQVHELEKKLIKDCCIWLIEGKNGQEFDLIKLSTILKEFSDKQFSQIPSMLQKNIDYYRDIIVESAEKKNYGLKLTKDISTILTKHQNTGLSNQVNESNTVLKVGLHEVWEIKEIQQLCNNAKIEVIDFIRKNRRQHTALLKSLEKLIKAIEKGKGEDESFSAYQKIVMNPPKMKVQTKINGKGTQKATLDKSIEENLKKMKIDSGNATPTKQVSEFYDEINCSEIRTKKKVQKKTASKKIKNSVAKKQMSEELIQNSNQLEQDATNKSVYNTSVNNYNNPEQEKQINQKINQNEQKKSNLQTNTQNNQKDNNQKNLFNFFKKNNNNNSFNIQSSLDISVQSELSLLNKENPENLTNISNQDINQSLIDTKQNENNQVSHPKNIKSLLRKIGSADPRPQHLQTTEKIRNINSTEEVFSIIKQESKSQWNLLKKRTIKSYQQNSQQSSNKVSMNQKSTKNNKRRILILIHDYVRQFKNSFFDQKSKIINPRNFLARDDDLIQYDMDSEDELQELNAENIENEEDDMDEEDFEDEDSGNKFIVPDGYLSDEGFDSDKEDVFNQKKLNFQNFNFAENSNKQGFIFQEKDKVGDVQCILMQYRAKKYDETENFPLCLQKQNRNQDESVKTAASIVWTNERLKQYIRAVHGSYQSKKHLLEQISKIDLMKDISKYRIENKFKEIAQKDEKQESEVLKRWVVHSAIIESLEFEENEMEELKKFRQDEYRQSRQIKKDEKAINSQQTQQPMSSIQNSQQNINSQEQQKPVEQQESKPIVGYNIFATQAPLKKNANITPIKPLVIVQEEQKLKNEVPQVQSKQEMIEEGNNKNEDENNTLKQQKEQSIISQLNQKVILQTEINQVSEESQQSKFSQSSEFRKQSKNNSFIQNENSNKSSKKNLNLQTTLRFTSKKS